MSVCCNCQTLRGLHIYTMPKLEDRDTDQEEHITHDASLAPDTESPSTQPRPRSQHNEWWLVVVLCCAGWVFSVLYLCSRHLVRVRPGGPGHGRAPASRYFELGHDDDIYLGNDYRPQGPHTPHHHPPSQYENESTETKERALITMKTLLSPAIPLTVIGKAMRCRQGNPHDSFRIRTFYFYENKHL